MEENGLKFVLKVEQKKAIRQLFKRKDLLAVLPTGYGKSLIFQLLVLLARRVEAGNYASLLVITPLVSIKNDQIMEAEAMNLAACNLAEKLDSLEDIEEGKFDVVYAPAESAIDKRFLQSSQEFSLHTFGILLDSFDFLLSLLRDTFGYEFEKFTQVLDLLIAGIACQLRIVIRRKHSYSNVFERLKQLRMFLSSPTV